MGQLPEQAALSLKGVFMNADAGFDSEEVRMLCAEQHLEANLAKNQRNGRELSGEYQYFDEELYKER